MRIDFFKTFEGITEFYGDVPESFGLPTSVVETKYYDLEEYWGSIGNEFTDGINKACGTLLDYGDVDFFDAKRCKMLVNHLRATKRPKGSSNQEFYDDLLRFAHKAIKLNTGIVVEL